MNHFLLFRDSNLFAKASKSGSAGGSTEGPAGARVLFESLRGAVGARDSRGSVVSGGEEGLTNCSGTEDLGKTMSYPDKSSSPFHSTS